MFYTLVTLLTVLMVKASATALSTTLPSKLQTVTLNDGNAMPIGAFGTFVTLPEVNNTKEAMLEAIKLGFRSFDTSLLYYTEPQVGEAIKEAISSGLVTREELFITTKFDLGYTREYVAISMNQSLQNLQLDYVDLYLVHLSFDPLHGVDFDEVDIWKGMIDIQKEGKAKSIGTANYGSKHINKIIKYTGVIPAVNQIEVHPAYASLELVAYCQSLGITVMAYGSHGLLVPRLHTNLTAPPAFNDTILMEIGKKYDISTNLVVLCYLINRNIVPVSKSYTLEHTKDNVKMLTSCPTFTKDEIYTINEFNSDSKIYKLNTYDSVNEFLLYYYNQTIENAFESLHI